MTDTTGKQTIFEFYAATEGAVGFWNRSRNDYSKGALGRYGLLSSLFLKGTRAGRIAIIRMDRETDEPFSDTSRSALLPPNSTATRPKSAG